MPAIQKVPSDPICNLYNLEAEQSVLGAILLRPNVLDEVIDGLRPEDFYRSAHGLIFKAIMTLAQRNEPVDLKTVFFLLEGWGKLNEVGGASFLSQLSEHVGIAANVNYYAKVVKTRARFRYLHDTSLKIAEACRKQHVEDAEVFFDWAENQVFQATETAKSAAQPLSALVAPEIERIKSLQNESRVSGVPSGFIDIDNATLGFQPSNLIVIAARPSMGKTALALNIALNAAMKGTPVLMFSKEMSNSELVQRLLARTANINLVQIRNGRFILNEEWHRLKKAQQELEKQPFFLDETPNLTPLEIRSRARRLKSSHGIGLIIVDYLQLINNSGKYTREQEVSGISRSLKALAKELKVPVIALSQLSRRNEDRLDKRPLLSDLRESGAIEQDSDLVMLLYRDEIYKPNTEDRGLAELRIAKQRNGPTPLLKLSFDATTLQFRNYLELKEDN